MMRALALLLVVVNLGYLAWATWIDARPDTTASSSSIESTDTQRLVLASERPPLTTVASANASRTEEQTATVSTPVEPVATNPQCISIGPFQDLSSAAQATATLKSAGRDSRQRVEQGQLWVGYWVSIPGFAKREDAERAVARLKQNGITDVYISLGSADHDSSNVVSLGVFKESERAQRLLAEAKKLGFAAQITDRTRAGSVYWVDVDMAQADTTLDLSTLSAQPGKILRLEQRTCP